MPDKKLVSWLVLTFRLPHKPSAPRVRIWRRLQNIGAVALKESVYVLPENKETVEDFHWLAKEITSLTGEVVVFRGTSLFGMTDKDITKVFNEACNKAYEDISEKGMRILDSGKTIPSRGVTKGRRASLQAATAKLKQNFEDLKNRDFFSAPGQQKVLSVMATIEKLLQAAHSSLEKEPQEKNKSMLLPQDFQKKLWITRKNIFIDRIASAWLIKKFIDPWATFAFVEEPAEPGQGIPFDMDEGEFTHRGDHCTFETILDLFALKNPALAEIAQIVHDLDLKDGKYSRPEVIGMEQILHGLCKIHSEDTKRLKKGVEIFDSLYSHFSTENKTQTKQRRKIQS